MLIGFNRENTYVTAITLPSSVLISFVGSVPLCILTLTGFHQKFGSAKTDDQITSLYTWNDGSLWILRCFGTLSVTLLAFYSYQIIKDHSITQKTADVFNELLRDRDLSEKSAASCEDQEQYQEQVGKGQEIRRSEGPQRDVEMVRQRTPNRNTSDNVSNTGVISNFEVLGTDDSAASLSIDARMLLLHLTSDELEQLLASSLLSTSLSPSSLSSSSVVKIMHRHSLFAVIGGSVTLLFMLAVCIVDAICAMGGFSTLLLSLSLLLLAFIIYQFLRAMAFSEILDKVSHCVWTAEILLSYARVVLQEVKNPDHSVATELDKQGIVISESDRSVTEDMSQLLLRRKYISQGYSQVNTADSINEDGHASCQHRQSFTSCSVYFFAAMYLLLIIISSTILWKDIVNIR